MSWLFWSNTNPNPTLILTLTQKGNLLGGNLPGGNNPVTRYLKCLNMTDNVNWDIGFMCQASVSLFTLVQQNFLLLYFWFDTSLTVLINKYYFT